MIVASRSWTGFVVKNSHVASQEFNRNAEEGRAQAALGWSGPLQSQTARSATA
ncbi:FixH family protein [Mesorhizobium sp. M0644]|uniref:FixH family protein n=1 Tax=Mesorhizobium sp. M0644 TaxID=2956979 RepID=UPI00333AD1EC